MSNNLHSFISFYPCHDLAATRDFYERDLGLNVIRDQQTCLIFKITHGAYLGFCQHETSNIPDTSKLILTFLTDDVDSMYHKLRQLNIETEGKPKTHPHYQIHHFFARDPDGYRVEIQRFLTPLE